MDPRTQFRRHPERGSGDRDLIDRILDEGRVAHVGYLTENRPVVVPTLYVRDGARLLMHGSPSSGLLRAVRKGSDLCATVTLVDGVVLARSAFNHSINYRSVVVHGRGELLGGSDREVALDLLMEKLIPGRSAHLRPSTTKEYRSTGIFALGLEVATAKVRSGPPVDDPGDIDSTTWAGVVPIETRVGSPLPDPHSIGLEVPAHVRVLQW